MAFEEIAHLKNALTEHQEQLIEQVQKLNKLESLSHAFAG
jgi:hypothetical protein